VTCEEAAAGGDGGGKKRESHEARFVLGLQHGGVRGVSSPARLSGGSTPTLPYERSPRAS